MQEEDGKEVIGVVFASCALEKPCITREDVGITKEHEKVVKIAQYVEWAHDGARIAAQHARNFSPSHYRFYVVLETDNGDFITTEKLANGIVTWVINPNDQEARNSLARVSRSMSCPDNVMVRDFKKYQTEEIHRTRHSASPVECSRYANDTYNLALPAQEEA